MKISKVFDPSEGFAPLVDLVEVTDPTLAHRDNRWWMYLAGQTAHDASTHLFSASLPEGAPLAAAGWRITADPSDSTKVALLSGRARSAPWDRNGGRHCPSYVKGWDPHCRTWVERIYYAGSAEQLWGPYTIGYLEWDGQAWVDQPTPAFTASEPWERGSVYEPNILFHDGKWKLWYVAGSNQEDYLVHGYSESEDGRTNWTPHKIFAPAEWKLFDFCVIHRQHHFEAVFSRVWLAKIPQPETTGLWWTQCDTPSPEFSDWSEAVQIMTTADSPWRTAPWKPAARYSDVDPQKLVVYFDALRHTGEPGPFPFAFTLGCLELDRPK